LIEDDVGDELSKTKSISYGHFRDAFQSSQNADLEIAFLPGDACRKTTAKMQTRFPLSFLIRDAPDPWLGADTAVAFSRSFYRAPGHVTGVDCVSSSRGQKRGRQGLAKTH